MHSKETLATFTKQAGLNFYSTKLCTAACAIRRFHDSGVLLKYLSSERVCKAWQSLHKLTDLTSS